MTTTPPGWYDDGHGAMRWWDGAAWTEHVATADEEPAEQPTAQTVPLYPGGYAQATGGGYAAYPGTATQEYPTDGGAFIAATEPHKSKLWVVWVVLGVVVLAIVIGFSVLIPMYMMAIPRALVESSGPSASAAPSDEPTDAVPSTDAEQAAVDAVNLYDSAYQNADCDAYLASTTSNFRDQIQVTDCEAFAQVASDFATALDDYVTTVTDVQTDGDSITVDTVETYTSAYDQDGNKTDQPQAYEDDYEYIVVQTDDGGWAIDDSYTTN